MILMPPIMLPVGILAVIPTGDVLQGGNGKFIFLIQKHLY